MLQAISPSAATNRSGSMRRLLCTCGSSSRNRFTDVPSGASMVAERATLLERGPGSGSRTDAAVPLARVDPEELGDDLLRHRGGGLGAEPAGLVRHGHDIAR